MRGDLDVRSQRLSLGERKRVGHLQRKPDGDVDEADANELRGFANDVPDSTRGKLHEPSAREDGTVAHTVVPEKRMPRLVQVGVQRHAFRLAGSELLYKGMWLGDVRHPEPIPGQADCQMRIRSDAILDAQVGMSIGPLVGERAHAAHAHLARFVRTHDLRALLGWQRHFGRPDVLLHVRVQSTQVVD